LKAAGDAISRVDYHADGWIEAFVPGTVLGSQVADGIFPDPYFGMNLRKIPGTDYPITKIFGYLPMSADSPYRCPWWYRVEFRAEPQKGETRTLHFDGINYRANIWLNGKEIASSDKVAGAFRAYDIDATGDLSATGVNALAVEVFAQTENDLGIDFLDWNPAPADKSLGLWRGVSLLSTGAVSVVYPFVSTHFTKSDLSEAALRVGADLVNHSDHAVKATLKLSVGPIRVSKQIHLGARESKDVVVTPDEFPQLLWSHPPVWWPYQYGEPRLEELRASVDLDGVQSDDQTVRVGIREATSFLNERGFRQFQINGKNISIKGGGWTPDLFYREPKERLRQELSYARDMGLNAVRLEGKLGGEELFDLADRMGILVMAGWQCCDYWQKWDKWNAQDREIAVASQDSQISRLRSHPSLLVWLNGSDEAPVPSVEKDFLDVLKERGWPNPVLSAAADKTSPLTGKSGVKMTGPYDYVPPEYWYLDKGKYGGAYGFNTETGPGPAIPSAEDIHRTLPEGKWWPINEEWNYHAALGKFAQYDDFNRAMAETYGAATNLDNYELKAHAMAYDGERAMFEAYGANKYSSTGVIQWMLNNAWPSFIWHLYDYYLVPGGGYFGTKKANEPTHIQYRYDDRQVVVVDSTLIGHVGLRAAGKVFSIGGKELFSKVVSLDAAPDGVAAAFSIPAQSATTFLWLELRDARGSVLSRNFYWIPARLAQLDWDKTTYVNTPAFHYADMRDLSELKETSLTAKAGGKAAAGSYEVTLRNGGGEVAFFLHAAIVKAGTSEEVAPVLWSDNFISLLPGESRELRVEGLPEAPLELKVDGWNVQPQRLAVPGGAGN